MPKKITPKIQFKQAKKIAIVAARFNDTVNRNLVEGALTKLQELNIKSENIKVYWVPGALEIALSAKQIIQKTKPDALIAIGTVIRGETDHYNVVCNESAKGIATVSLETQVPILNAILTCDTVDQALNRSGLKSGNKGAEAAQASLELLSVLEQV
jgi:6,7-dimethyl-8-ribityllumazine synthase